MRDRETSADTPRPREPHVRLRALLGYALVIAAIAIPSSIAVAGAYLAAERRDHVGSEYLRDVAAAERLRRDSVAIAADARGFALAGDPSFPVSLAEARADLDAAVDQLRERVRDDEGAGLLDEVHEAAMRYDAAVDVLVSQRGDGGGPPSADVVGVFDETVAPRWRELVAALDAYVGYKRALTGPAIERANRAFRDIVLLSVLGLGAAIAIATWLGVQSSRRLNRIYHHEREAARLAEDALAARDELLGIVAHDLRSPLTAIALKAGMLVPLADDARIQHAASSIEKIALRMEHLIQSLLDAAAISEDELQLAQTTVPVDALVRETLDTMEVQAEAKGVALHWRQGVPLVVVADRERTIQVLVNLIDNAIKFTPRGGAISLAAEALDGEVAISVSDTGSGIEPDQLAHVFDRFWKARSGGKRGAGLGLFIARALVDAQGGRIWAESEPGAGSRFTFTLPREERPIPPPPARLVERGRAER